MPMPTLTANSPGAGSIAWTAFHIAYRGQSYDIAAGNTNQKYVWWPYNGGSGGALQTSNTLPTLTDDDLMLFLNRGGVPVNTQATDLVQGDLVVTGSIVGTAIAAGTIQGDRMAADTITAREIGANVITANEIQAEGITAEWFAVGSIGAKIIGADIILGEHIEAGTVDTENLAAEAITSDKIAAQAITADKFTSNVIMTGAITLSALDPVTGLPVGQRVIGDSSGLRLVDVNDKAIVTLPTTGLSPAKFTGELETTSLTVLGGMSVQGTGNEIAKDGSLALSKGVSPPVQTPSFAFGYDYIHLDTTTKVPGGINYASPDSRTTLGNFAFDPSQVTAFSRRTAAPGWIAVQKVSGGCRLWYFNADGTLLNDPVVAGKKYVYDHIGWTKITGVLERSGFTWPSFMGLYSNQWYMRGQLASQSDGPGYYMTFTPATATDPSFGYDQINQRYMVAESPSGDLQVRRYITIGVDYAAASLTGTFTGANNTGLANNFPNVLYGNFDLGGARYLIGGRTYTGIYSLNSANGSGYNANEFFMRAVGNSVGFDWDGTNFYTLGSDGNLYKHTTWTWTDTNDTVFGAMTYYDSDAAGTGTHETTAGNVVGKPRVKRAKLMVTMPSVPDKGGTDDPDKWRLYAKVAPAASAVVASDLRLQATGVGVPPSAQSTVELTAISTVTAAPPTVNGFPGANPAKFYTAGQNLAGEATVDIMGSGKGHAGPLRWNDDGSSAMDKAKVYLTADKTLATGAFTDLLLGTSPSPGTVEWDTNTMVSIVSGITRITVKKKGLYVASAHMRFGTSATGYRGLAMKHYDVSSVGQGDVFVEYGDGFASQNATLGNSREVMCEVGDWFNIQGFQNSGADMTLQGGAPGYTWMSLRALEL